MARKDFNNQEILKRLFDTKPVCTICGANSLKKKLNLHHKDLDSSNDKWTKILLNIGMYFVLPMTIIWRIKNW